MHCLAPCSIAKRLEESTHAGTNAATGCILVGCGTHEDLVVRPCSPRGILDLGGYAVCCDQQSKLPRNGAACVFSHNRICASTCRCSPTPAVHPAVRMLMTNRPSPDVRAHGTCTPLHCGSSRQGLGESLIRSGQPVAEYARAVSWRHPSVAASRMLKTQLNSRKLTLAMLTNVCHSHVHDRSRKGHRRR